MTGPYSSPTRRCPRLHPLRSLLALTFLLLLLLSTATANHNTSEVPTGVVDFDKVQSAWRKRIFTAGDESPISKYFRRDKESNITAAEVFDYIDKVWEIVKKRRESNDSKACNLYSTVNRDWVKRMRSRIEVFGIGKVDDSCHSKVDVRAAVRNEDLTIMSTRKLRDLFIKFRQKYSEAYHDAKILKGGDWELDGRPFNFTTIQRFQSGQECTIDSVFAYRLNKQWFLKTGATNQEPGSSRPEFQRQYLLEFISRNSNESLHMQLRNETTLNWTWGTTVLTKWRGKGYDTDGGLAFDDPIGPLSRAYQRNLVAVDLASDAITVSNIAILALPMAMNLIPVAFIADLHAIGMLIYVIVTDVFSTIPFLIKGVELIQSSKPTQEEVYAFFLGDENLGCMQSWAVLCKGKEQFREVGIAFVIVAILALVFGILLELWAKRYMHWKRARAKDSDNVSGPFGKLLEYDVDPDMRRISSTYEEGRKGMKQVEALKAQDKPPSNKRRRIIPSWIRR